MTKTKKTQKPQPRLLDQVRERIRLRQMSRKTEKCYVGWIARYIRFHGKRHPREMAESEVTSFLTHLAAQRDVSASTQRQALCATSMYLISSSETSISLVLAVGAGCRWS